MKGLHVVAFSLMAIGALNWGLVGFFDFNLVSALGLGGLEKVVYMLVGLSAVYVLVTHKMDCMICMEMMGGKKKGKK